eukprot:gene18761-23983_t
MMLGPVRRARFDAWLREMRDRAHKLLDFRGRRREARRARAETDSLIRRVKASNPLPEGDWDDNVFRPKQFEGDKRRRRRIPCLGKRRRELGAALAAALHLQAAGLAVERQPRLRIQLAQRLGDGGHAMTTAHVYQSQLILIAMS